MEYKLIDPFEYNGKKIEKVKILKTKPSSHDRIMAKIEAKRIFGEEDQEGILFCLLNKLCDFGEKIPSPELSEKLSAEDFDNLLMKIMGIDEDFLLSFLKNLENS